MTTNTHKTMIEGYFELFARYGNTRTDKVNKVLSN